VETLADVLLLAWEARPDEHADQISRKAYAELVLKIAQIDDQRPDYLSEEWPRVREIYDDLSTTEVERVGTSNLVNSHLLQITPSKSEKTANGWTATRTSYELHPAYREKTIAALELGEPEELAEVVDGNVKEDLRKRLDGEELGTREDKRTTGSGAARQESLGRLVGFFSPGSSADAEPSPGEAREGSGEGGQGSRGAGRPPRERPGGGDVSSNGCYTRSSETASNRRFERSDREKRGGSKLSKPPSENGTTDRDLESFHEPHRSAFEARGTRKQRRFLDERVRMPAERLLFLHLLGKSREASYSAAAGDEWITVPADTLEQEMGAPYHSTYRVWRGSDLVEAYDDGFYVPPNEDGAHPRAREFRVPDEVMEKWNELGDESRRYWLHTEEPERTDVAKPLKTDLSDENNNSLPGLVDRALRVLKDADHPIRTDPIEDAISALSGREGQSASAQKVGLQFALETIERQTTDEEDGVSRLKNAYEMTFGGRIIFKDGGPQGMLGAVKARAYDIEGLRNYDIKSCHTSGLRQVADKLEDVGVDVDISAWEEYPGKDVIVEQTGLPRTLVKITEHGIKYGAYLPVSIAQAQAVFAWTSIDANQLQLVKAARKHADDADEALGKLHDAFGDMRRVIKEIAEALLDEYYDATNKGGYMHNACGVPFNPRDYDEGHERKTKVMAWMLQGLEAAFVHSLTILSAESDGYDVVANEHDGLIVKGEIPEEAIEVARIMSGFHRAELVEKPHADEDEIAEVYGEEDEKPTGEDHSVSENDRNEGGAERFPTRALSPASRPRSAPKKAPQTREESRAG